MQPSRRLSLCLLLFGLLAAGAGATASAGPEARPSIGSIRRDVETGALDPAQREQALAQLDAAAGHEREADALVQRLAELRAEATSQPTRMTRLRAALELDRDKEIAAWEARLPPDADGETLERLLKRERAAVADLDAQVEKLASGLAQALSGPARPADELAALRQRVDELSVPAAAVAGEPAALGAVRQTARAAELRRLRAELELKQAERELAGDRQQHDELALRELRFRQSLHARRVAILHQRVADLGRREIEKLTAGLTERETALAETRGSAFGVAARNRVLGEELLEQNARLADDRATLALTEAARDRVAAALRDSRARLEIGGASEAVGRWLWSERRRLEAPARLRQRLDALRGTLAELRLRLVITSEEQRELVDVAAVAREISEADRASSDEEGVAEPASESLEPLLRQRVQLLGAIEPLLRRRITTLERAERVRQQQLDDTLQMSQLLDRHLLWSRSHSPIDASWLGRVPEGLRDLVKPSRWKTTVELSLRELADRPLRWALAVLVVLASLALRRSARARIEAQVVPAQDIGGNSFQATLRALGWTLLGAAPGPVVLWLLGELLQDVGNPGRYSDSLGRAFGALVLPLASVQLLRWMVVERGLAHVHFRWMRARRETLRRTVPRAAGVVLPMYFVTALAFIRNLELPNDVQARVAIVVACGALAWTLWRALDVGRLWVVRGATTEASASRRLLRFALPVLALVTAVLALIGYVHSAGLLLHSFIMTFAMLVAISLLTGLLARWFLLGERRLSLQRSEELRVSEAELAGDEPAAEPEPEMTLEQINAQTGRLLRALRLTLVAVGFAWVWAQVIPAVARLDEIALWHFAEAGAGGEVVQHPVTLMAAILGALVLTLTFGGARNLPGLVEIGLLSRTKIDAASRYAATSVLRYAIVIAGTVIGLGLLGMRWSQLQWLAAALSVGLGFGLQEIFANFVSGLILLFERPFRVGDVITIGASSGRVLRIRTRATTILDFDNKEIVVPNKSFITGEVTNWTLSDSATRIVIKVGVAYGSDPSRVRELLLAAARANPLVAAEPEPVSVFLAFGASSLDFELRVFVGAVADRLVAQDQLNTAVAESFAEHGIEIAFPQLDLHVRDVPRSTG
ncbi:MAG: mechanosensitive ion channel [Deltaproteobacteria bacterium]|nr:mechanosensitive ion channel [Deltaproteobacteria bacterium]